jgi:hypothetical protein
MAAKTKPVHEIRIGRIRASIWANQSKAGRTFHKVTVQRLFKTDAGWRSNASFARDDLPLVAKVLDAAHSWIFASRA